MSVHEPIDDEILGRLTWDADMGTWQFEVGPIAGRSIPGTIRPDDDRQPLNDQGLDEIRTCVQWIRANEPAIRSYIASKMFNNWRSNWYDEDDDAVATIDGFRDAISLASVSILEDRKATLIYDDGDLFGGHAIVTTVGADGRFEHEPHIWG
jgi:hypothetical protein